MKSNRTRSITAVAAALAIAACGSIGLAGCSSNTQPASNTSNSTSQVSQNANQASTSNSGNTANVQKASSAGILDTTEMFSGRDMEQTADLSNAKEITLESGKDTEITEEGTYVVKGAAENATIIVNADGAKVQIVLDGASITNAGKPAVYVGAADKVFLTTSENSENTITVTGNIAYAADDAADAAIFSRDDIVVNGLGKLTVNSGSHGIVGKDDVKVTGGTLDITSSKCGIQGKDSVKIAGGTVNIEAGSDAIHAENEDDGSKGYVYVADGTLSLKAGSDGIGAASVTQIDGGEIAIEAAEGIEGTYVQVNGGAISIKAVDDGINATNKSASYDVVLEINGGQVSVDMGQGDTDALDVNGNLIINGGAVDITAQSAFDFDGKGELNGGEVTVNGERVSELTNQMMGGRGDMIGASQTQTQGKGQR